MKNLKFVTLSLLAIYLLSAPSTFALDSEKGIYSVPVKDAALKPYAEIPINVNDETTEKSESGKVKVLHFTLPPELVGAKAPTFKMIQDPKAHQWTGESTTHEKVVGLCKMTEKTWTCDVRFFDLKTNIKEVNRYLKKTYSNKSSTEKKSETELMNRYAVATVFHGEPEGVITYFLDAETKKK